jgi:hypothetical protein
LLGLAWLKVARALTNRTVLILYGRYAALAALLRAIRPTAAEARRPKVSMTSDLGCVAKSHMAQVDPYRESISSRAGVDGWSPVEGSHGPQVV